MPIERQLAVELLGLRLGGPRVTLQCCSTSRVIGARQREKADDPLPPAQTGHHRR